MPLPVLGDFSAVAVAASLVSLMVSVLLMLSFHQKHRLLWWGLQAFQ